MQAHGVRSVGVRFGGHGGLLSQRVGVVRMLRDQAFEEGRRQRVAL